ncbi:MAG TPA: serine/threonine protein kinase [Steroidobacteraceae bacterium]|nr:serine/threonine protein kinase [Steroidobacteraceae bacterium]
MINKTREDSRPFASLSPDVVLDAAAAVDIRGDGRLLALNSYENRVYQLGTDDGLIILKFYRRGRWSDAQILEEHIFTRELAQAELPVAAPLSIGGETLFHHGEYRFAAFPWLRGRTPELDAADSRVILGRTLARMHRIGALGAFRHRPALTVERLGHAARRAVLASGLVPQGLIERYARTSAQLLEAVAAAFAAAGPYATVRLHGDCHLGNLLWSAQGPAFVDLDDCMGGPAVQDLWMLLSGSGDDQRRQWAEVLEGYGQFADFDLRQLPLIEPLRALRMLHHAAWVAQRWSDPAFPRAFPWFGEARNWENYITDLADQWSTIQEPPLLL